MFFSPYSAQMNAVFGGHCLLGPGTTWTSSPKSVPTPLILFVSIRAHRCVYFLKLYVRHHIIAKHKLKMSPKLQSELFLVRVLQLHPMKSRSAQLCALPGNAPDCAIGALIGLHGPNNFKKNSDCRSAP